MTEYRVEPATEDHARGLALTMREADVAEVWAMGHYTPEEALLASIQVSHEPRTGLAGGRVMCMFGVGQQTLVSREGIPWLLMSDEIMDHTRHYLRESRAYIDEIKVGYGLLLNFVDARNIMSLRWLEWLEFEILPPRPYGIDQLPFHPFRMEID